MTNPNNSALPKWTDLPQQDPRPKAALAGAAVVVPGEAGRANAQSSYADSAEQQPNLSNPIVPNFQGQYSESSLPTFQVPKRSMGSTGLQV